MKLIFLRHPCGLVEVALEIEDSAEVPAGWEEQTPEFYAAWQAQREPPPQLDVMPE